MIFYEIDKSNGKRQKITRKEALKHLKNSYDYPERVLKSVQVIAKGGSTETINTTFYQVEVKG